MWFKYLQCASMFLLYVKVVCANDLNKVDEVNILLSNEGWWKFDKTLAIVDRNHISATDLYVIESGKRLTKINPENYNIMVRYILSILSCTFSESITEISIWFTLLLEQGNRVINDSFNYGRVIGRLTDFMFKIRRVLVRMQQAMTIMGRYGIHSPFPSQITLELFSHYLKKFEVLQDINLINIKDTIYSFALKSFRDMDNLCVSISNPKNYKNDFINDMNEKIKPNKFGNDPTLQEQFFEVCKTFDNLLDIKLNECCTSRGFIETEPSVRFNNLVQQNVPLAQSTSYVYAVPSSHSVQSSLFEPSINNLQSPQPTSPIDSLPPVQGFIPDYAVPIMLTPAEAQSILYKRSTVSSQVPLGFEGPMTLSMGPTVPSSDHIQDNVGIIKPPPIRTSKESDLSPKPNQTE